MKHNFSLIYSVTHLTKSLSLFFTLIVILFVVLFLVVLPFLPSLQAQSNAWARSDFSQAQNRTISSTAKIEKDQNNLSGKIDQNYLDQAYKEWSFSHKKDGVLIFTKKIPNSPIVAIRGMGLVAASVDKILHNIRDVEKSHEWTPNLKIKKMAKTISMDEGVTYNYNNMPWPATDRETLVHSKLYFDERNNFFNLVSKSVDLPNYPPNKKLIRAIVHDSYFIFKPINEEVAGKIQSNETFVDIIAHIDPKGLLPSWMVNLIQKDWPYSFLKSLEKQSQQNTIPPQKEFTKYFEEYLLKQKNPSQKVSLPDFETKSFKH